MRVRLTNRHCRLTLNGAVKAAPSPSREEFSFRDTRCDNRARNVSSQEMLAVAVNIIVALVVVALLKYDDLHSCLFIPIAGDYAQRSYRTRVRTFAGNLCRSSFARSRTCFAIVTDLCMHACFVASSFSRLCRARGATNVIDCAGKRNPRAEVLANATFCYCLPSNRSKRDYCIIAGRSFGVPRFFGRIGRMATKTSSCFRLAGFFFFFFLAGTPPYVISVHNTGWRSLVPYSASSSRERESGS